MKSRLLLLLFACGHQAGGVHLHPPETTAGPTNSTARIPVAVVMFDSTYMRLFDCFLRYWTRQIADADNRNKLDVVAYDIVAYRHAQKLIGKHPAGWVRELQLREVPVPARRMLRRARPASRQARAAWSSLAYQSYYWKAILEHLERGDDVLHVDLDAIVVGSAWAPLASSDPGADIVGPPAGPSIGHEYILYRNTPATKEVVEHFWSIWLKWFSGAAGTAKRREPLKPPLPAEQKAFGEYVSRYNPGGCSGEGALRVCRTHAGGTFTWHALASLSGLQQNGQCKFPEECHAEGTHISHGRHGLGAYCPPEEIRGAQGHP